MERKQTLLLTVIAVATLLVAVVGATFAFFTASGTGSADSEVTVTTSSIDTVNTTASNLTLQVGLTDMLLANGRDDYSARKQATSTITMSAGTGTGGGTNTCTYDLSYTPNSGQDFTQSAANTGGLNELTISAVATNPGSGVSSDNAVTEFSLDGITTEQTLIDGGTFAVSGVSNTDVLTWTFTVTFYNLAVDQSDNAGATFGGTLSFKNVTCVNS